MCPPGVGERRGRFEAKRYRAAVRFPEGSAYGTHNRQTKNLRAVQLLLGHSKLDNNTVRYLGIEVDDALELAEAIDV